MHFYLVLVKILEYSMQSFKNTRLVCVRIMYHIGTMMLLSRVSDNYFEGKKKKVQTEPKEMITPALEKALTKQGNENILNTLINYCKTQVAKGLMAFFRIVYHSVEIFRMFSGTDFQNSVFLFRQSFLKFPMWSAELH